MRQPDPSNSEFNFPKTTCRESFSPGVLSTSSQHARRGSSQLYSKLTYMYLGGVCVCVCVCLHVEPSASRSKATCRVQTAGHDCRRRRRLAYFFWPQYPTAGKRMVLVLEVRCR